MGKDVLQEIKHEWYENAGADEDEAKIAKIKQMFIRIGLSVDQVNVIIDRFVYDMPLQDIATRSGFVDAAAVAYFLAHTLKYVKSVGANHLRDLLKQEIENV